MTRREELHDKLKTLLGSDHVYYQPPENLKMEYPAIRYSKYDIYSRYGDDTSYTQFPRYQIIVIDKRPDNAAISKILELPMSSYDRHYISDNLHHDVITLYY